MKYYYREHILGYDRVKKEGKVSWGEIHGVDGFENFSSREFLEEILPKLEFTLQHPDVLECGCGTGPGACYLAEKGFNVDAIDLIPTAIEIADEQAKKRGLDINFKVMDVCEIPHDGKKYDMIIDSFCLQGIVTEADRQRVFSSVWARLKPEGYYVISTAMFDEVRLRQEICIRDTHLGINCYGYVYEGNDVNEMIDRDTGIVYRKLGNTSHSEEDAVRIGDLWFLPVRRHRRPDELKEELENAGFKILYQDDRLGGNLMCILKGSRDKA